MVYLFSPYVVFLGAEAVHFSGIIAVVTTGIVGTTEIKHTRLMSPRQTRWHIDLSAFLLELLNGAAFVSLGLLIARIFRDNWSIIGESYIWITASVVLYLGKFAVRYLYIRLVNHRSRHSALVFAVGGVHGAVNFALALSVTAYGLPRRSFELIVMAEAMFILLSMIVPPIIFKHILPAKTDSRLINEKAATLKRAMVENALSDPVLTNLPDHLRQIVTQDIRSQLGRLQFTGMFTTWRQTAHIIRNLTDAEQLQRRSVLLQILAHERAFLEESRLENPEQNPIIDDLVSEVLVAESVIVDLRVV